VNGLGVVLAVVAVVVLVPLVWVIVTFNRFVRLRQHIRESWSGIDVELKRRYDLIPNLVETVKGYAAHERETLERVVELRNQASANHGAADSQADDESELMRSVGRLFALAEGYPELKADQHFLELQKQLSNTEDRIAATRRFYNGNVREMNQLSQMFPTSLVASVFGFKPESFFELSSDAERVVPRVNRCFERLPRAVWLRGDTGPRMSVLDTGQARGAELDPWHPPTHPSMTVLRSTPISSTSTSTLSPASR
jgi:LemA protein